ncbi:LPXTG cell wall anchor domain-containing protein [Streptomyces sp. TG1A-60]|uniref:LPXTG cell wall anchor domain-containing protein n=1 Tax=Streptomyces sp. TG1A-60 TaxID=3129111 RepID=UPI0030CAE250
MSVARRASPTARRSLLTATAAGALLGALWFVPSANATQDAPAPRRQTTTTADTTPPGGTTSSGNPSTAQLADTGSPNTTPYVIGGTALLGLGGGFVAYSIRREREVY